MNAPRLLRRRENDFACSLHLDRRAEVHAQRAAAGVTDRCAELDLRLPAQSAGVEVTAFLATLGIYYRLTGKFKQS